MTTKTKRKSHKAMVRGGCSSLAYYGIAMATTASLLLFETPAYAAEAESEIAVLEELTVTGSRRKVRSPSDIPAPVDVIDVSQLANQGATNISDLIRAAVPSFNVSGQPISGTASSIRPANLRGLSPDHILILVNGKRRHRSADIPTFGSALMIGSQGPDLGSIPTIALKSVEVLRDGAAAQYGADAIAGVMNFILNDNPDGGRINAKYGQYSEGDGGTYSIAASYGFELGNDGFMVLSGEYSESNPTDRSRDALQNSIQALVNGGNTDAIAERTIWGAPTIDDNLKLFMNMAVEAGDNAEFYSFGSYAERETRGNFFYRSANNRNETFTRMVAGTRTRLVGDLTPDDGNFCAGTVDGGGLVAANGNAADQAVIAAAAADPNCFTWANAFPGGFSPVFGSNLQDNSLAIGFRGETESGINWDVSGVYGKHEMNFYHENVAAPSFGRPDVETAFEMGGRTQEELTFNLDASKEVEIGAYSPLNVAVGLEWHKEEWSVTLGDVETWDEGPLFDQGFRSAVDGYIGYGPSSVGSFDRSNVAAYLDMEGEIAEGLVLGAAVRYENFTDLGDKVTTKLSALWHITEELGIRGTFSTGFHAPTPAQQEMNYSVTVVSNGELVKSGIIPVDNTVAQSFGAVPSAPESSTNFSVGLVYEHDSFSVTFDYYHIKLKDRLTRSTRFDIDDADRAALAAQGLVGTDTLFNVQFFTNDFDTKTQGADLIITVPFEIGEGSSNILFAGNWNTTEVTKNTSLTGPHQIRALEESLPEFKGSLTFNHTMDEWRGLIRANYYGDSTTQLFTTHYLEAGAAMTVDLEVGYSFTDEVELAVGATNILNKRPKDVSDEFISGIHGIKYAPEAPWGFNGTFLYGKVSYNF